MRYSSYFQTSSETIRKDIIELEDSKIIKKSMAMRCF
ncbi:MAG: DeoR family transcriptional regulator [Holdemanella porci]